jgi:predicted dehydrogenase
VTETYKVGLVGCGGMGRSHLKTIREHLPEFEIAALCDPFSAAGEIVKEEFGLEIGFQNCETMCDEKELDLVVVATQTRQHHKPTVAALERGISVLCEKPIAIDPVEADEMVAAAQKSGAKLAIHQQNHVNPAIRKAQQMVAEGVIGDVVMIRGRNKAGRKSGNEFMEMGTHVTDMMICFGGAAEWCAGTVYYEGRPAVASDIMEAKEMSPKDRDSGPVMGDRAFAHYGFASGILGEIHFFDYARTHGPNYGVDVLGTEGQLAARSSATMDQRLWHLPRPMDGSPPEFADWQGVDLGAAEDDKPIAIMYRALMKAFETGGEPPSSGVEGRAGFEMILGIYESHRRGGCRVDLPMADRRHPLVAWRSEG